MNNIKYITRSDVDNLTKSRTSDDVIIFLSGPTSKNSPLSLLRSRDVITVNGSAEYLINNKILPFIYVLTDARFLHQRRDDFYKFSSMSKFTIVNKDVYEEASDEDKKYLLDRCLILRSFYKREKGGFFKKLKFNILSRLNDNLLIDVPMSKKRRLVGFSKDISTGYCSCHTVAYTAIQIAYSLKFDKIVCSGLDLTGNCQRFYEESKNPLPSELSKDLFKIIPFFKFMRRNVKDINIYNLSNDTAIDYDIIPFISPNELANNSIVNNVNFNNDLNFHKKIDSCAG